MENLYYPEEEAFLCDYFGIERPVHLRTVDVHRSGQGFFVENVTDDDGLNLANAVARLGLDKIQHRLPQWYSATKYTETYGRTIRKRKRRAVELFPVYLFTINWADSGPGFSWPEAYHMIRFPGFNRLVVTASQDSPDAYGVEDMAVGWLPDNLLKMEAAEQIIIGYWIRQRNQGQERWAYLFDEGLISVSEAELWADEVWPEEDAVAE